MKIDFLLQQVEQGKLTPAEADIMIMDELKIEPDFTYTAQLFNHKLPKSFLWLQKRYQEEKGRLLANPEIPKGHDNSVFLISRDKKETLLQFLRKFTADDLMTLNEKELKQLCDNQPGSPQHITTYIKGISELRDEGIEANGNLIKTYKLLAPYLDQKPGSAATEINALLNTVRLLAGLKSASIQADLFRAADFILNDMIHSGALSQKTLPYIIATNRFDGMPVQDFALSKPLKNINHAHGVSVMDFFVEVNGDEAYQGVEAVDIDKLIRKIDILRELGLDPQSYKQFASSLTEDEINDHFHQKLQIFMSSDLFMLEKFKGASIRDESRLMKHLQKNGWLDVLPFETYLGFNSNFNPIFNSLDNEKPSAKAMCGAVFRAISAGEAPKSIKNGFLAKLSAAHKDKEFTDNLHTRLLNHDIASIEQPYKTHNDMLNVIYGCKLFDTDRRAEIIDEDNVLTFLVNHNFHSNLSTLIYNGHDPLRPVNIGSDAVFTTPGNTGNVRSGKSFAATEIAINSDNRTLEDIREGAKYTNLLTLYVAGLNKMQHSLANIPKPENNITLKTLSALLRSYPETTLPGDISYKLCETPHSMWAIKKTNKLLSLNDFTHPLPANLIKKSRSHFPVRSDEEFFAYRNKLLTDTLAAGVDPDDIIHPDTKVTLRDVVSGVEDPSLQAVMDSRILRKVQEECGVTSRARKMRL